MPRRSAALLLFVLGGVSCRPGIRTVPPIVQPGPPGVPGRIIAADRAVDLSSVRHTAADVQFMQGMIGHHRQALEMTALVPSRTTREDVRMLARRIEVSQADEIEMMRGWLALRGERVPAEHAHHAPGAALMPGMLTADEMGRLAGAHGAEFERLFLESMIKHHDGALIMVRDLFSSPGAAQDTEIFAFASDVEADQSIEISRMAAMLQELRQ